MSLAELETAVYRRQPEAALAQLNVVLTTLLKGQLPADAVPPNAPRDPHTTTAVMNRVAAAMATFLADPQVVIPPRELNWMLILGGTVDHVFQLSAFQSSDGVIRSLPGYRDDVPLARLLQDPVFAHKFLVLFSLNSELPCDARGVFGLPPTLRMQAFMRLVNAKPVTTAAGQARRDELLAAADQLAPVLLPPAQDYLVTLSNAFMHCSYASHPNRHRVKAVLNQCIRLWLERAGLADAALPAERPRPARPKMAVLAEVMQSSHVQYRFFGQWLRQLRQRFELVLVTETSQVDDHVRGLYDRVFAFERWKDGRHVKEVAAFVAAEKPDIAFYPSVGMRHWGTALANLRLAPIQATALGHSASTYCPTVDYYVVEEGYFSSAGVFSETAIVLPDSSTRFERNPQAAPPEPVIRDRPDPARIGVPSNLLKLNPRFLAALRRVQDRCPRVEFDFFPNVTGFEEDAARALVRRWLPSGVVYRMLNYAGYLEKLSQCDLVLSPFPFGGLHSVVDALSLGVPVVAQEGAEPHARTDSMILRLAGMPEALVARTEDEFVETAVRLITDHDARTALAREAVAKDIRTTLFGNGTTPLKSDVVDAFWWVYENHEAVQQSGRRAWTAADRAAFRPS